MIPDDNKVVNSITPVNIVKEEIISREYYTKLNISAIYVFVLAISLNILLYFYYYDIIKTLLDEGCDTLYSTLYRICWLTELFVLISILLSIASIYCNHKPDYLQMLLSIVIIIISLTYGLIVMLKYSTILSELIKYIPSLIIYDTSYYSISDLNTSSCILMCISIVVYMTFCLWKLN